jgi:mannose-1-phosphate guanylyltransferase
MVKGERQLKAFLMAAGLGTRLKPITDTTPKCLVPIKGKPILGWWLERLEQAGVTDVLINTHYLSTQVKRFTEEYAGRMHLHLSYEPVLLGSLGTLASNRSFVDGEEDFLVLYADNLTDINLNDFIDDHCTHSDRLATMALFRSPNPSSCGIVTLDSHGIVTKFEEKPAIPDGDLANAGMYIFKSKVWDDIGDRTPADIGYNLLPQLVGRMAGYVVDGYFMDIGTIQAYEHANATWPYEAEGR